MKNEGKRRKRGVRDDDREGGRRQARPEGTSRMHSITESLEV